MCEISQGKGEDIQAYVDSHPLEEEQDHPQGCGSYVLWTYCVSSVSNVICSA